MRLLCIDVGSSAIKSAILLKGKVAGRIVRVQFPTRCTGTRVEVDGREIMRALGRALRELGAGIRQVDCISLSVMSPAWVALDQNGQPLTPIVTHQDRRSVDVALELEKRVGKARHLRLAGNRPFPGGVSSTTYAWFNQHARPVMKKADLVGHLNTFLHRHLTHSRVIDPSNACFMGLHNWQTLNTWNDELIDAVGASEHCLPQIIAADAVGGMITHQAATLLGLTHGTPMTAGCMDASAAMLATGAKAGQILHVSGSTDALLICTGKPRPHEKLLTCPVGAGRRWMSISTIAAAGSALVWAQRALFADLSSEAFLALAAELARKSGATAFSAADALVGGIRKDGRRHKPPVRALAAHSPVRFEPYLAGDRMTIEQRQAAFCGLTLGTGREEMLAAIIESLASASAARIALLKENNSIRLLPTVVATGGVQGGLDRVLHRGWPKGWKYRHIGEATLLGLAELVPD
jgi:xylulokinase